MVLISEIYQILNISTKIVLKEFYNFLFKRNLLKWKNNYNKIYTPQLYFPMTQPTCFVMLQNFTKYFQLIFMNQLSEC